MLVEIPWLTDGSYEFKYVDAIYSLLLDNPTEIYILPARRDAFICIPGRGLIHISHNFAGMTPDQISKVVDRLLKGF